MYYNDELIFLAVELKYCERCGGLYLRRSNGEAKLCEPCTETEQALIDRVLRPAKPARAGRNWPDSFQAAAVSVATIETAGGFGGGRQ